MLRTLLLLLIPAASWSQAPADWLKAARPLEIPPVPLVAPALERRVVVAREGASVLTWEEMESRLSRAEVVMAGEKHDEASHHALQFDLLRSLHESRGRAVVGLEMLGRGHQKTLDAFLSGEMPEEEFRKFWTKEWGYSLDLYLPLLDYARRSKLRVIALNAPRDIIRLIARGGLSSLTPGQRALLPERIDPISEPRYLAYVKRSLSEHGPLDPVREARMLEAMAVWNETMADSIASLLKAGEGPVLVVAGMGHMLYGAGIGESLSRRGDPLRSVVLPYPLDGERLPIDQALAKLQDPSSHDIALADFFRLIP